MADKCSCNCPLKLTLTPRRLPEREKHPFPFETSAEMSHHGLCEWRKSLDTEENISQNKRTGCGSEADGLEENKEIASKAVQFVIRAVRKGAVPLCSSIAELLREIQRLQRTVEAQSRLIAELKNTCFACRGPVSTSCHSNTAYSSYSHSSSSLTLSSCQAVDEVPEEDSALEFPGRQSSTTQSIPTSPRAQRSDSDGCGQDAIKKCGGDIIPREGFCDENIQTLSKKTKPPKPLGSSCERAAGGSGSGGETKTVRGPASKGLRRTRNQTDISAVVASELALTAAAR